MLTFERPDPDAVSMDLAQYLQFIALRGWTNVLSDRGPQELKTQFQPYDIDHVRGVREVYREFAQTSGLIVAYDESNPDPIGFALAREDVSGNPAMQFVKRNFMKDKVYAWIRHVCIDGPSQRQGHFRPLIAEALSTPGFRPEQIPTAYIFDENTVALGAFQRLDFALSPDPQEPTILQGYFGEGLPVAQRRFAAPSVEHVLELVRA